MHDTNVILETIVYQCLPRPHLKQGWQAVLYCNSDKVNWRHPVRPGNSGRKSANFAQKAAHCARVCHKTVCKNIAALCRIRSELHLALKTLFQGLHPVAHLYLQLNYMTAQGSRGAQANRCDTLECWSSSIQVIKVHINTRHLDVSNKSILHNCLSSLKKVSKWLREIWQTLLSDNVVTVLCNWCFVISTLLPPGYFRWYKVEFCLPAAIWDSNFQTNIRLLYSSGLNLKMSFHSYTK